MRLMTWRALSISPYVEVMQLASRALARMSPEGNLVALSPGSSVGWCILTSGCPRVDTDRA